jgi:Predicted transcriptional regulator
MELSKHLSRLRKARRLTQSSVAEYLSKHGPKSYTFKTVSQWETGVSEPSVEAFLLMCELYDVRDIKSEFGISVGGGKASSSVRALNSLGNDRVGEYTQLLLRDPKFCELPREKRHVIKLYDLPVSAGHGVFLDGDDYDEYETSEKAAEYADFAVRIQGDSMSPRFVDGQVIFIEKSDALESGEIGIFTLNGEALCKKLGDGELISLNSNYSPIEIGEYDALYALGRVLS